MSLMWTDESVNVVLLVRIRQPRLYTLPGNHLLHNGTRKVLPSATLSLPHSFSLPPPYIMI